MNVCVLSFFRNSARSGQVDRFMAQAVALRDELASSGHRMRIAAVWGDCVDNTVAALQAAALEHNLALTLIEHTHGGPEFGSTEHPDRLVALSALGNAGLVTIRNQDDAVFYVESDLEWSPFTVVRLLSQLSAGHRDIIAPMIWAGHDEQRRPVFYDIFCFRKNGHRFGPFYPYAEIDLQGLTHVDSVGSAFVMTGEAARDCRIINDNVLMGFCRDAWDKGYTVSVDARESVVHP